MKNPGSKELCDRARNTLNTRNGKKTERTFFVCLVCFVGHSPPDQCSNDSTPLVGQSPGLHRLCGRGIGFAVRRIKAAVALMLAFVWLPAVSCCLIDASGLLGRQDCCAKEHSHPASGPGKCDKPCGTLASASYLPQQSQLLIFALVGVPLSNCAKCLAEIQRPSCVCLVLPATAPPELAGQWQFFFRTALSPRAPSLAS